MEWTRSGTRLKVFKVIYHHRLRNPCSWVHLLGPVHTKRLRLPPTVQLTRQISQLIGWHLFLVSFCFRFHKIFWNNGKIIHWFRKNWICQVLLMQCTLMHRSCTQLSKILPLCEQALRSGKPPAFNGRKYESDTSRVMLNTLDIKNSKQNNCT